MWHDSGKWAGAALAVALVIHGFATEAFASAVPRAVPEIDPGSVTAGVALLAGGLLILRARMRK